MCLIQCVEQSISTLVYFVLRFIEFLPWSFLLCFASVGYYYLTEWQNANASGIFGMGLYV